MRSFLSFLLVFTSLCAFSQVTKDQTRQVDFTDVHAKISILPQVREVKGDVSYTFSVLEETDSIFIDARNMDFNDVTLNGKETSFSVDGERLWIREGFKPSVGNKLNLRYSTRPAQTMYFINWDVADNVEAPKQVWTQGQGRYTSHWLPSFDDMKEKAVFSFEIDFPEGYEVVANGILKEKVAVNDTITRWHYEMEDPMSSYLVAVVAGDYEVETTETSGGIPILMYYRAGDEHKVEPTYRYSAEILEFLESETAVPYPWKRYAQLPVQDFLFSGMENTGTTVFSNALMVDSIAYNDQNYVNVNAHELAHQWFGNYVTAKTGEHHWLQEGFATYYALLAEKELFGEDYYYWKLFQSAEELKAMSDQGKGEALLRGNSSSLTYYQKGAWALHILNERVGEKPFKQAVTNYLKKYAYSNVDTDDFLNEVEEASGTGMDEFKRQWLQQSAFQGAEALESLKRSDFIRKYMEVAAMREVPLAAKMEGLERALDFPVNDYIGQEVVYQLEGVTDPSAVELYLKAFDSGILYVRQAMALSLEKIPADLKEAFIKLLEDESYITKENALLKLWLSYPEETEKWLEKTRGVEGFTDKNVKMLWLVINLVSPQVEPEKTAQYFEELSGYTREYYPFEVRQNAFGYLYQINAFTDENLKDLLKGSQHHTTRFRDFSRQLLERLLQEEEYRQKYVALKQDLSGQDRAFLETRLN